MGMTYEVKEELHKAIKRKRQEFRTVGDDVSPTTRTPVDGLGASRVATEYLNLPTHKVRRK